ncbi:winged helix-turn-helix domain-containing protein [Cryptosporangium phraense]|uniref:Winged helix-turn-helix transcriptional regulator n=1 Tax=Cryptosporangium phraense TaxID=2593070 RepID=A0A545AII4_9ACTN|nr:winged helix-turn-helix domain-containing protein [Cryptosporangium phraense]TQS41060.1 winged helix-turn-helix transcriptional regulator [Cryptosporangium phraense]
MTAQAELEAPVSARVLVEIDLTGGHATGVASTLCAEISDLLAEHARTGDTAVSANVSLDFGEGAPAAAVPAGPAAPAPRAPLRILAGRRVAVQDGADLTLTRREFDLLSYLARHPRQVFSRRQLIDAVWGTRFRSSERTIDVHVRRLRAKLSGTGPSIVTIRGVGYRLDHADRVAVLPGVD